MHGLLIFFTKTDKFYARAPFNYAKIIMQAYYAHTMTIIFLDSAYYYYSINLVKNNASTEAATIFNFL